MFSPFFIYIKRVIKIITFLILGVILTTVGLSLLNGIAETITVLFELLKAYLAVQITKQNTVINELTQSEFQDQEPIRAIGFSTITDNEDDDYE